MKMKTPKPSNSFSTYSEDEFLKKTKN